MTADDVLSLLPTLCATVLLPANAIISFGDGREPIVVGQDILYQAPCPGLFGRDDPSDPGESALSAPDSANDDRFSQFRDPFYATTFPMCYALAATTVTAYMLVIMLFVTPRSFLDGGVTYLGRRGFTSTSPNSVNIGGRPWLQKLAALTVAISLTVATVDTFKVAQQQYMWGIQNARSLQIEVMGSTELKVIRLVSDTFLWLAQAQTLIRIFPRQREKTIIKWAAFALITLDVVFTAINSFRYSKDGVTASSRPHSFVHPIPALSYLFQLSLGLLYAAWVIYYSITKRKYAFYHPLMKNICLVAAISVLAVFVPVVFFILDISKPDFTGWGDYVRWVGAAAASVVVWEWVERIESLERQDKKDGVLGREVFDGDDTLDVKSSDFQWLRRGGNTGSDDGPPPGISSGNGWPGVSAITNRYRAHNNVIEEHSNTRPQLQTTMGTILRPVWPSRPAPVATPVSRTDTTSAASTVYAVRYQATSEGTSRTPDFLPQQSMVDLSRQNSAPQSHDTNEDAVLGGQISTTMMQNGHVVVPAPRRESDVDANSSASQAGRRTLTPVTQPVPQTSQAVGEGAAVESAQDGSSPESRASLRVREGNRWDLRSRLEVFAANQAERLRDKIRPTTDTVNLPVTVIPAPARRGAALQQVLEEEEASGNGPRLRGEAHHHHDGDILQLSRSRSAFSTTNPGQDGSTPPPNPPLWPGVQNRIVYDDYDDYSYDGDSMTEESSSVDHQHRESGEGSGQSQSQSQSRTN